MSSRVFVPFDNNPTSVSVKTASYTIPSGKYAKVVVNLEGSATFTINGTLALRGTQNSVLASDNMRVSNNNFSFGSGYLATTSNSDTQAAGSAFTETTDQKTVIVELWLPTGTVLNGTGTWRAVVMEYNAVT
jgi:hypothetical protein